MSFFGDQSQLRERMSVLSLCVEDCIERYGGDELQDTLAWLKTLQATVKQNGNGKGQPLPEVAKVKRVTVAPSFFNDADNVIASKILSLCAMCVEETLSQFPGDNETANEMRQALCVLRQWKAQICPQRSIASHFFTSPGGPKPPRCKR